MRRLIKHLIQRIWRRPATLAFFFTTVFLVAPLFLYHLLAYPLANDPRLVPSVFRTAKNILLVTAHPDDETLFFSPSILYHSDDATVTRAILVLSSGNYDGIGNTRHSELQHSCAELGITPERCLNLDHYELQDNPRKWWREDLIEELVGQYVQKWNIDLIITFDSGGVSGHVNHRAVSAGVSKYISKNTQSPPAYTLQTRFLLRKYAGLADLIPTSMSFSGRILRALVSAPPEYDGVKVNNEKSHTMQDPYGDRALLVSDWRRYFQARRAFSQHGSQYSFDRVFYLLISRYMWVNDLRRVV
ncbi:putative deacetylase LmbE-like domain-containing protein [Aspergillus pseudonomiae]|uniref:N-acetylglucosaminylphosphatidylinositol deacetylase n=1 Tax=Aspergillus pseudonomiae TaxID=1506151 RepID=A0A5N7DL51_9EURO|nr:putative deacetylase LmbE-like domain-containing protein [Aspergillus pseudonomiae]KAE8407177.1 putative deacetylase LmbE-like domain-containing protein [Aspergillus pseudonomiae]